MRYFDEIYLKKEQLIISSVAIIHLLELCYIEAELVASFNAVGDLIVVADLNEF